MTVQTKERAEGVYEEKNSGMEKTWMETTGPGLCSVLGEEETDKERGTGIYEPKKLRIKAPSLPQDPFDNTSDKSIRLQIQPDRIHSGRKMAPLNPPFPR